MHVHLRVHAHTHIFCFGSLAFLLFFKKDFLAILYVSVPLNFKN